MLIQNNSGYSQFIWKSKGTAKPVTSVSRPLSLGQRVFLCGDLLAVLHLAELVDLAFSPFFHVKAVKEPPPFSGAMVESPRNVLGF